jgi:hypothetical protein
MAHLVVRAAIVDWDSPVEPIERALKIAGPSPIAPRTGYSVMLSPR